MNKKVYWCGFKNFDKFDNFDNVEFYFIFICFGVVEVFFMFVL